MSAPFNTGEVSAAVSRKRRATRTKKTPSWTMRTAALTAMKTVAAADSWRTGRLLSAMIRSGYLFFFYCLNSNTIHHTLLRSYIAPICHEFATHQKLYRN